MSNNLIGQTAKSVLWSALERISIQGTQFILSIIIARLVVPAEYGLIAMLGIFLAIAQAFVDSGFSNALIQKKNRNQADYSTVFYFNIVVSIGLYILLYFTSHYIANFYHEPLLEKITKLVGLNIILSSLSVVQRAILTIKQDFKTQAKASFISVIISGGLGISCAYYDYGVWALVVQSITMNALDTLLLWIFAKWHPSLIFSWHSFKTLFSYGSKLLMSGLLHTIYMNLYSLVIGKKYSASDVGFYNRASSFAQFPSANFVGIISRAVFPMQCLLQDDDTKLKEIFIQYLRLSIYIIFPLMMGLVVLAKPFIELVLTDKWLGCATPLSILCFAYIIYPVANVNGSIINAKGRTDYIFKAEIIKKTIAILILAATIPFNLNILCLGLVLYNVIDLAIIIYYAKKVIATGYKEQLKETLPTFLLSLTMGIFVYAITFHINSPLISLSTGVVAGIIYYVGGSLIFNFKEYKLLKSILKFNS